MSWFQACGRVVRLLRNIVGPVVENLPAVQEMQEMWCEPWGGKTPWRRKWQPTLVFLLRSPMDRGALRATVHELN